MDVAKIKTDAGSGGLRMRLLSERALGERVVAGDSHAFAELFRRFRQPLYGFCVSILGNPEDGADALQNTMTKALKALPGEERDLQLKPWLFRVARNECIDLMRSKRITDDIADEEPVAKHGVEAEVTGRERLRELVSDLEHLPEKQRSALVMRELSGLSFEEIGNAFEATPGAAKQVVYEARVSLQDLAEGRKMECDPVRQAISADDGRVLRGRRVRAHLRSCESCQDFKLGIDARKRDLRALVPPIPAAAIAAVVDMINGPGGGGAAIIGLAGVKAAFGGSAIKTVAAVAVTVGIGAGTVGIVEKQRQKGEGTEIAKPAAAAIEPGELADPASLATDSVRAFSRNADRKSGENTGPEGRNHEGGSSGSSSGDSSLGRDQDPPGTTDPPVGPPDGAPGNSGSNPGGSGGSNGLGASPTHGGKPAELPDAAAQGQENAAAAQSQGGRPANPGQAVEAPGAAKSVKPAPKAPPKSEK